MSKEMAEGLVESFHEHATNVVNCMAFTTTEQKRKLRKTLLMDIKNGIEAYRRCPEVLEELNALIKYSN